MLVGAGGNIAVSVGGDGLLLVGTGSAKMTDKLQAAVQQLATRVTASPGPNDLAIPEARAQGGTWIIPGHGRLIRDRIQDLIQKGMTLEQVKAARPTMDFDGLYGSDTGPWTTDMFIEAAYRSLTSRS